MRRKQEAGPGRSSSGRASSPLFSGVRGIGILRSSDAGSCIFWDLKGLQGITGDDQLQEVTTTYGRAG
jgi:hypothetical protein